MGIKKGYNLYKNRLFMEGGLSFANFTLLNGIFLIGFGLAVGANDFQLGVLLSIPLFASLLQTVSAYILEATGTKKWTAIVSQFFGRFMWVAVIAAAFGLISGLNMIYFFGIVLLVSSLFIAVGNLALLSWMKDLIPTSMLGRFFGKRNIYASIAGIIAYLLGSYMIDRFDGLAVYGWIFLFALAAGMAALFFLKGLPEKKKKIKAISPKKFIGRLKKPFYDTNFRHLLYFGLFWGFAVNIASPFFLIYLLDDLSLSFFLIALFLIIDTVFRIYGLSLWRNIADKFGAKPTLVISATITSMVPLAFLFINKGNYLLVPVIFFVSAIAYAGFDIGIGQILFKSSPRKYDAYYLSSYTSLTGFVSALGPIIGGLVSVAVKAFPALQINSIPSLKYVFLLSFILRALSLPWISGIHEPKAREINDIISRMKTLRLASFFINFYTVADYSARLVLFPQKQFFILQRKTVNRLKQDMESTKEVLGKLSSSLSTFRASNIPYYKTRFRELRQSLSRKVSSLKYADPTVYYELPRKIMDRLEELERDITSASKTELKKDAGELKQMVEKSGKRLDKLTEKKLTM